MTSLTEEFCLAGTPRLRSTIIVARSATTASTLEHRRWRLALWHKLGNHAQHRNDDNCRPNEHFRLHNPSPYA
jgi:hypothetical protein